VVSRLTSVLLLAAIAALNVTMSVRPSVGDHAGDVVNTSDAEVQSSVIIFSDESSLDEVFSISCDNVCPSAGW
jgi:hypothetical protein